LNYFFILYNTTMNIEGNDPVQPSPEGTKEHPVQQVADTLQQQAETTKVRLRTLLLNSSGAQEERSNPSSIHTIVNLPEDRPMILHLVLNVAKSDPQEREGCFLCFPSSQSAEERETFQSHITRALDVVSSNDEGIAGTMNKRDTIFFVVVDAFVPALREEIKKIERSGTHKNFLHGLQQIYRSYVNGSEDGAVMGFGKGSILLASFIVLLSKKSLASFYKTIALLDHELGHISRVQQGRNCQNYKQEERENYSESIARLEKLAALFPAASEENPVETYILPHERESLESWVPGHTNRSRSRSPRHEDRKKRKSKQAKRSRKKNR